MSEKAHLTFTVSGMAAAPQGSKKVVGPYRIVESSANVKPWRFLVQQAAVATGHPCFMGPISLSVVFLFARPKGHYTAKGVLKADAPTYHVVRPDGSKCLRSTEDALVDAGLIHDDARIAISSHVKRYCVEGEHPGAIITILSL